MHHFATTWIQKGPPGGGAMQTRHTFAMFFHLQLWGPDATGKQPEAATHVFTQISFHSDRQNVHRVQARSTFWQIVLFFQCLAKKRKCASGSDPVHIFKRKMDHFWSISPSYPLMTESPKSWCPPLESCFLRRRRAHFDKNPQRK